MLRLGIGAEALEIQAPLRPWKSRRIYYEELESLGVQGEALKLKLYEGSKLSLKLGAQAEPLALELREILEGPKEAHRPAQDLESLRETLGSWLNREGFSARPFVDYLLRAAQELGASDLHLRPLFQGGSQLSLRMDGVLLNLIKIGSQRAARLLSRLKVLSKLQVHRSDCPQEGRVDLEEGWVRLSFVPSVGGESLCVRLFDRLKGEADFEGLGFNPKLREQLEGLLSSPSGVLLFTGPSASGKTTTLYTALRHLLARGGGTLRAITVEDPVEYLLEGVVQLEASTALSGAPLLRAALRQDADILVVGEARDRESVELMLRAGLTGHRVLGTLHAGSAVEALSRLLESGAPVGMICAAVRGILSQRLIRRRCCPSGCERCGGTGYRGRTVLAELLLLDEPIQALIRRLEVDAPALAQAAGLLPLIEQARPLIEAGISDQLEVQRLFGREL